MAGDGCKTMVVRRMASVRGFRVRGSVRDRVHGSDRELELQAWAFRRVLPSKDSDNGS